MAVVPVPLTNPVKVAAPVPPLATDKVPVTPVAKLVVEDEAAVPYPCPTFQK